MDGEVLAGNWKLEIKWKGMHAGFRIRNVCAPCCFGGDSAVYDGV
jgi:hypothetical protein